MIRTIPFALVFFSMLAIGSAAPTANTYENLNAVLWVQTSVEYKASATQAYRTAESALLRGMRNKKWTAALEQQGAFEALPPAVILDLDETVLDNSVYEARLTAAGEPYNDSSWVKWVNEQKAVLVPGAMHFLQFAQKHGVTPIYITNRMCDVTSESDSTVQLLRHLQVPIEPVQDRLFCTDNKDNTDKSGRRAAVASKYRILLSIGDDLKDFLPVPKESANLEGRQKLFAAHANFWGERWIQLPNPMYGSWEGAVGYSVNEKLLKLRK